MRSSHTSINRSSFIDVAFVFHMKFLETQLPNCAGMTRVYNWLTEVCSNQHLPFSTIVMDSYPSRIWHTILAVKDKIEKNLNDKKQYQMCRKMLMVTCSLESWNFLVTNLVRSGALVIQFSRWNTRKRMLCDLSLSSTTDRQSFILLCLDTCQSMDCAHKSFGYTFGVVNLR